MSIFEDQAEFMKASGMLAPSNQSPDELLARKLIQEEFTEFEKEEYYLLFQNWNALKECIDLIYVCSQYMNATVGPDKADKLWTAVHEHNMQKLKGTIEKRLDGKVLKPEGYNKHGWKEKFKEILI